MIRIQDSINLQNGKQLYEMMCSHCHAKDGSGLGSINEDDHPAYSTIPSYQDDKKIRRSGGTMKELKEGHIFHAITYGLNAMGPHASQITEEERWKIVYYIKESLQKTEN